MKLCNKLNLDGIHDSRFHPDRADPWVTARSNYLLKARQRCVVGLAALLVIPALAQPTITVEPRGQFVWEGMTVSLNVSVRGTAPVSLQWQYDGESIPDATNRTLNLARLTTARSGSYRVIAVDPGGAVTSQVARVIVRAWPQPTGPYVAELNALDTFMKSALVDRGIPGGSLAVVKDGRLVFARGYGYADAETHEPFQPDSLCRVGSMGKTVTAAAVMKLVEEGKLELTTPVFDLLGMEPPDYPGAVFDPRWTNIVVRHLLNHTGGWDEENARNPLGRIGFLPNSWPNQIAKDLGLSGTPTPRDLVRWLLGKPLQYRPGTTYRYADTGFDVAGEVIATVTGQSYESAVREFLRSAGVTRMKVGSNTRADRAPGEVSYYLHPTLSDGFTSTFEPRPVTFDLPYAWPVTLYAAAGGWIASAIDFVRLMSAVDGQDSYPDVLSTNSVATMLRDRLGWSPNSTPSVGEWFHTGSDTGNLSIGARRRNGAIFVFLRNSNLEGNNGVLQLSPVVDSIRQWPTNDLFSATLSRDAWRSRHFDAVELSDPAVSGDEADPDGDGLSNLLEYAHGTKPRVMSSPSGMIARLASTGDGHPRLAVSFRRLLLAHEIEYFLQTSSDLKTWSDARGEPGESSLNPDGTLTVTELFSASESAGGRYYRLRIERKPVL